MFIMQKYKKRITLTSSSVFSFAAWLQFCHLILRCRHMKRGIRRHMAVAMRHRQSITHTCLRLLMALTISRATFSGLRSMGYCGLLKQENDKKEKEEENKKELMLFFYVYFLFEVSYLLLLYV